MARILIEVCFCPAAVPGGSLAAYLINKEHAWFRPHDIEIGLGPEGNMGQPDLTGSIGEFSPNTGMNDHSGDGEKDGVVCVPVTVEENCKKKSLRPGSIGQRWVPFLRNRNTAVKKIMERCCGDWSAVKIAFIGGRFRQRVAQGDFPVSP
ncbi:hypothetical protein N8612_04610 [Verrucomicrobia bacterium]|nr:hypothetical protein [Verrucomicrobiota bacterium]